MLTHNTAWNSQSDDDSMSVRLELGFEGDIHNFIVLNLGNITDLQLKQ